MTSESGVSSSSDNAPALLAIDALAKDAIISWFRSEFAAANAIIDALSGHLSLLESRRCEYEPVFAAIHRRRLNWIPILQMQKYYSIAEVTLELHKVADEKARSRGFEKIEEVEIVRSPVKVKQTRREVSEEEESDRRGNGGDEAVDDHHSTRLDSATNEIIDAGSEEMQPLAENIKICSNLEEWETWRAQIKMTKGFIAKECVKGHMVNVVRGLKLYENILTNTELTRLNDYVNKLQVAGKNGELSGETFITYNQQPKVIKRELIQFGAPIFGQIKDGDTSKSQDSHIEPIPAPLEGVIDHLIKYRLISENRRPNSCIISFFDKLTCYNQKKPLPHHLTVKKGEFSQPFMKPPHLDEPISTLILSESTMAFGHTLVCDQDGNYKGPLTLSLKEGSLLVMRGNSAGTARHATCQSPTKRTSITFFKVYEKNSSTTGETTVWQPGSQTPNASLNDHNPINVVSQWGAALGASQLLMLAPVGPVVLTPRRQLPCGGTGVFLPWSAGSKKLTKHQPPHSERGRILT